MSISLIAGKLGRLNLIDPEGGGISLAPVGPLVFVSDGGDGFFVDPKAAWQDVRTLDKCTLEQFMGRAWLHAPSYETLADVWEAMDTPMWEAAERIPRSSDYATVGRLRRFGAKEYLIQTESGDYGIVDEKQTAKWRLTPLD